MAHTPSPWYDDGYRIYAPTDASDKRTARVIVEYKYLDDFNAADAHLIAAAPELLAALKEVERSCPCGARPESPQTHPHVIGCPIGAAIAKAEGR